MRDIASHKQFSKKFFFKITWSLLFAHRKNLLDFMQMNIVFIKHNTFHFKQYYKCGNKLKRDNHFLIYFPRRCLELHFTCPPVFIYILYVLQTKYDPNEVKHATYSQREQTTLLFKSLCLFVLHDYTYIYSWIEKHKGITINS